MNLNEVRALVTGGASGLGKEFVTQIAEAGGHVLAMDLDEGGLRTLAAENENVSTFVGNVASETDVEAAVNTAVEAFGGLNCLVNNAGIFRDGLLIRRDRQTGEVSSMSLDDWQAMIDVDLTGPFLCTREVAGHMVRTDTAGVVINISSCSRHGNRGQSNYSAAKAGLVADTKLWAEELSRFGIRTGAIAPGFVRTPILEGMRPEMLEKVLRGVPLRRLADPREIWQGVKFIIECEYFTGRCIDVDGGITM